MSNEITTSKLLYILTSKQGLDFIVATILMILHKWATQSILLTPSVWKKTDHTMITLEEEKLVLNFKVDLPTSC